MNYLKMILITIVILSSCHPVYKASYSYIPPTASSKLECIHRCKNIFEVCESNEKSKYIQCDYLAGAEQSMCTAMYPPGETPPWNACLRKSCDYPDLQTCRNSYNLCYTNCGGKVISKSECTKNCEE